MAAADLGKSAVGADLVAPFRLGRRRSSDPHRANELVAIDENLQRARIGEIAE